MTSRITLGPPIIGAPAPTDAPFSVAYAERHGEGARQVTVLAVVTDPPTAELFDRVLSRDRLVLASDLAEGIALAEAESPEVVFVDVGVADGAGLALVHHIKVVAPSATVFALAGPGSIASGAHAMALGAAGLFILPLGGDEVLNAVHAVRARLVERAARGQLLSELRAHARATEWVRRMVELVDTPDWQAVANEVADVFIEATSAAGAAVYVARDEREGELAQRAASPNFARAPLFGTETELLDHARREQLTAVRLAVRKHVVGLVLLAPGEPQDVSLAAASRNASLDGFVRVLATQAATAFALRVERERAAGGALLKDPSSSAYSFAYYVDVAGREIDRARRYGRRFSIATIVLGDAQNGPKSMRRGQNGASMSIPTGEAAPHPAEVGDRLLSSITDIDVVARIDNDEFHLLLPETDGIGAHALRRRILGRLGSVTDRRPVPQGVLVGMATFPHDGRDLAQLLRVARRRADHSAGSIAHVLGDGVGLADLCAVSPRDAASSADDLFAARPVVLAAADATALAVTAVSEALRGGSALIVVAHHAGVTFGTAVRALLGTGRDGVVIHAVDTSASPSAQGIEALAVFAEHAAFAIVGKNDGATVRGLHAADPLFADVVAERIGRAAGARVLG